MALFEFVRRDAETRPGEYQPQTAGERAAVLAYRHATAAYVERWMKNLKAGVPAARFVDLPGAGHFVFLTRQAKVGAEIRGFVEGLSQAIAVAVAIGAVVKGEGPSGHAHGDSAHHADPLHVPLTVTHEFN